MAKALMAGGAKVTAIARKADGLTQARQLGATAVVGDAADAALINRIVNDLQPDVLILNAGARLLVPGQLMSGTALGRAVAEAYAKLERMSLEQYVLNRYGSLLEPDRLGEMVAELIADPRHAHGVAYGFRADAGIMALDLPLSKRKGCSAH